MRDWYIDNFSVDVDPEYFHDEGADLDEEVDKGVIEESENWDDVPF